MVEPDQNNHPQMSDLPEEEYTPLFYQPEELVEGEVVRIDEDGIVVSVGLKTEGIVTPPEMRLLDPSELDGLQPGDKLQVVFLGGGEGGGMVLLSYDQAQRQRLWNELAEHLSEGTTLLARIVVRNRGGLEVDYHGIRGFVPLSHLAPQSPDGAERDLDARIGQEAQFNVLELDQSQERLVMSERAIWRARKDEARKRFIAELEEGTMVTGKVTSLRGFGAFVNLGEVDGLIPMSELSWSMLKSADEAVSLGEEVTVQVLRVDRENQRISLSLKRTMPEPWETVQERFSEGQIVEGTVTRLMDFGAFVKLENWIEGLVHISELSYKRVFRVTDVLAEDQEVEVMVLSVDSEQQRISLSLKALQAKPAPADKKSSLVARTKTAF